MGDRVDPVRAMFDAVVGLDAAERERVLASRRIAEPEVVAEVEALLSHSDRPGLLDESPVDVGQRLESDIGSGEAGPGVLQPGTRVGAFGVVRLIGMGGMGVVYEAEQDMPRRRVALKLVRAEGASRALARRFEHEAAALALLQHQGIAQVYQAGVAQVRGVPRAYIAMELVQGVPITAHARQAALDLRGKLELIASVCDAVQHAHQRGVIHRDLKPGNILVTGGGEAKVLDFGIARLTGDNAAMTLSTSVGQIVGTLGYMSPEQALGDPGKIDTRTDVYALGVMLYELICGRRPVGDGATSVTAALHALGSETPRPPSASVPGCKGDVDVIVLRALEKEPERRYQSPGALAEDLRRHLRGEPIDARRDSAAYVLSRQLRRYRGVVAVGAAAMVAVGAFGVHAWRESIRSQRLARQLEQELSITRVERGRLQLAAGQPMLAELGLWSEWLPRHERTNALWALRELACRTGLGAGWSRPSPGFTSIETFQDQSGSGSYSIVSERTGELHRFDPDPDLRGPRWSSKLERGASGVAISRDGRSAVVAIAGELRTLDPSTGSIGDALPIKLHPQRVGRAGLALDAQGSVVYGWAGRDEVGSWSLASGEERGRASVTGGQYQTMALSPDGRALVVLRRDSGVDVLDATTLAKVASIDGPDVARAISFTTGGERLVLAGAREALVVDPSSWTIEKTWPIESQVAAGHGLDAHRVLLSGMGGPVILDVRRGVEWTTRFNETSTMHFAPGPVRGTLLGSPDQRTLRMVWPDGRDYLKPLGERGRLPLIRVAVSPDDRLAVVWSSSSPPTVLRLDGSDAGSAGRVLSRGSAGARAAAFSPDGTSLGVLSEGQFLTLYSTEDWSVRAEIRSRELATTFVFSPDSKSVILGGAGGLIARYRVDTGEPVDRMTGEQGSMTILGFIDEGRTLVLGERQDRPAAWRSVLVDAATLRVTSRVEQAPGTTRALLDAQGGRLLTMEGPRLRVLGLPDMRERSVYTGLSTSLRSVEMNAAGSIAFVSSSEGLVAFDVGRLAPVFQLPLNVDDPIFSSAPLRTRAGLVLVSRSGKVTLLDVPALDRRLAGMAQLMLNQLAGALPGEPQVERFSTWGAGVMGESAWTVRAPARTDSAGADAPGSAVPEPAPATSAGPDRGP